MIKDTKINVRLSEKVKDMILLRAMELGLNVSDYIRYLIMKDLSESKK